MIQFRLVQMNKKKLSDRMRAVFARKRSWLFLGVFLAVAACGVGVYLWQRPAVVSQRAVYSLQSVALPSAGQKVLFFSPHADDETIAGAGFIAQSLRNGADVRIVLVTDCNKHHNEDLRYTEFKTVTAILGVEASNLVFLGLPDGRLREQDPAVLSRLLGEQLDGYDPDIVLYPHLLDSHPDHYTTGRMVAEILKTEAKQRTSFQYLVHYKLVYPEPRKFDPSLFLLPPKNLAKANAEWQRLDLPQDIEDLKTLAAFSYKTQLRNIELRDLILSSIRRNEILAVPSR